MTTLDDVDRKMIDALRRDGRQSIPSVAAAAHIGRATAYHRFDRLVDSGVITGSTQQISTALPDEEHGLLRIRKWRP